MATIKRDDVIYISKLARLEMSDKEIDAFTGQIDDILEYMKKLNELDTDNVPPTSHVIDVKNVTRKDVVSEYTDRDEVLENAPDKSDSFYRVPKVIDDN